MMMMMIIVMIMMIMMMQPTLNVTMMNINYQLDGLMGKLKHLYEHTRPSVHDPARCDAQDRRCPSLYRASVGDATAAADDRWHLSTLPCPSKTLATVDGDK